MADPQGLASFGGVQQLISCSFTFSQGITPSVCLLEIAPQDPTTLAPVGPLVLTFGTVQLVFPDCKIDSGTYKLNQSGFVTSLQIQDRRWRWAFGSVSGSYNILNSALGVNNDQRATLDATQVRNAQQLALLCLQAMGEPSFDLSQVPTNIAPLVEWDREAPARALADVAEAVGCRVVLGLDNVVRLVKLGVGAALPTGSVTEAGNIIKSAAVPDSIRLVCGKTRFQCDFVLEAVGRDTDGTIKPVNNLSYKPPGGWDGQEPIAFTGVVQVPVNNVNPRDLAKATVWRWYRIKPGVNRDGSRPPKIPGFGPITYLDQITLEDQQVTTIIQDGKKVCKPAQVYGIFWDRGGAFINSPGGTEYHKKSFRVNKEESIVEFQEPMNTVGGTPAATKFLPATIYLRTGLTLRSVPTWAWVRFEQDLPLTGGQWATGAKIVKHDDVQLTFEPTYNDAGQVTKVTNNLNLIQAEITYYLGAAALEYQLKLPQEYGYAGLVPISPDGAIQQVSWQIGRSGTTTRASRNTEFSTVVPGYKERRLFEQFQGDQIRQLRDRAAAANRQLPGRANPQQG